MNRYDPDTSPAADRWLQLDEGERLAFVASYHRRRRISLPNPQLHAVIHVVVENQLALGEKVVVSALARLEAEGLTRHEAIHAIGSVLSEHLFDLMRESSGESAEYAHYLERVRNLTAATWRAG